MDKLLVLANSMMEVASKIAMREEAGPALIIELEHTNVIMPMGQPPFSMEPQNKEQTFRLCRALVAELKPAAVGFATEIWVAKHIEGNTQMPSDREDRAEALLVTVEDGERTVVLMRDIERWEGETKLGVVRQPDRFRNVTMRLFKVEELTSDEAVMARVMAECIREGERAGTAGELPNWTAGELPN